jgi:hypothetical protein
LVFTQMSSSTRLYPQMSRHSRPSSMARPASASALSATPEAESDRRTLHPESGTDAAWQGVSCSISRLS